MPAPAPDLEIQAAARLLAEGRPADAASALERLVDAAPAYAAGHVLLARALEAAGRQASALESWHRAHFLVPTSPLIRRERQRLLEVVPEGREAESAGRPAAWDVEALPEADERALETVDPSDADAPFDALWADETPAGPPPLPPEAQGTDASAQAPTTDAAEPAEMEAFDLSAGPGEFETALPPDMPSAEMPRVFGEDAFDATVDLDEPAVFTAVPDLSMDEPADSRMSSDHPVDEDEGWALIDETEHERPPVDQPSEATVAPPTAWDVVPTSRDAGAEPTAQPSSLEWDLDALIREIEQAPRIRPDPHFVPPTEQDRMGNAEDDEDVVSETLARIYETQGQFGEAAAMYEKLAGQRPNQADEFRRRARELRVRAGA